MFKLSVKIFLLLLILIICPIMVFAEDITITTYYPSPYGIYNSLGTDKLGVGEMNDGVAGFTSADVPSTSGYAWIKGFVSIGTTAATRQLTVMGTDGAIYVQNEIDMGDSGSASDAAYTWDADSDTGMYRIGANILGFTTNSTERIRIDAAGNVGIGTSPSALLHVNGTAGNPTGAWSVVSDARLKKDVSPLKNALETVMKLQGVSFKWKEKSKGDKLHYGFISQDVEKVIPGWVWTDKGGYKWLEKEGAEAMLVEAIKEQQGIISAQQLQINALKARLDKLEEKQVNSGA
jgi:hypothetical protein